MMLLQSFPWLMTFSALVWSGADIKQYIVKFNKQYFPMFDLNVTSPSIVDCATLCDTFKMDTAFSYNIADELCLIHSKYMRSTTLVTNVKWQLYEPGKFHTFIHFLQMWNGSYTNQVSFTHSLIIYKCEMAVIRTR